VLGGLAGLLVVTATGVYLASEARLNKEYDVPVETIIIPTDPASIERGKHLFEAVGGCAACHGKDLAGGVVLEDAAIGKFYASNLTSGQSGVGGSFSDQDFVRAIRHGVLPDNKAVLVMPSNDFYHFGDLDLGAIIAYVRSAPPVDREWPDSTIGPVGRALLMAGAFGQLPAEAIDHTAPRQPPPAASVSAEYGQYLVSAIGCSGCHGPDLAGGAVPGSAPDDPRAPNITPGGEIAGWSEAEFLNTLRTGVTPGGRQFVGDMPLEYGQMTDDELKAIFQYLQSLPRK
jgi:mono/diheme cytochrome c family protein